MSYFIAVLFDEETKDKLTEVQAALRRGSNGGNFSRRDNFHLTLAFLGEMEPHRLTDFEEVIAACAAQCRPFSIDLQGVGRFPRRGGDVIWAGISPSKPLELLYRDLCARLVAVGFVPDSPSYSPHVTLGRGVRLKDGFDPEGGFKKIIQQGTLISKISMMKSWRPDGRLTYTPVFEAEFGREGSL